MKLATILNEFKQMLEADGPIEIGDIVHNFPRTHKAALQKLWGGRRLVYKGKTLFDGDGLGTAYRGAMKAAEKVKTRGIVTPLRYESQEEEIEVEIGDMQEVYLGYSEAEDKLYIGYDVWLEDESLEKAFDKLYLAETGEEFDPDSDDPKFEKAWREFKKEDGNTFWGMLFELESSDGATFTADCIQEEAGGFYKGIFKNPQFKGLKLVDLRLD